MKRIFLIGLIAFFSCSTENKVEECASEECLKQEAYDKVIAVHDEVMPKLRQISELKGEIEEKMTHSIDTASSNQYIKLMQDLDAADESMMAWMRAFKSDIENLPLDSALDYLKSEQAKVDKVAENINSSIASAKAVLD